jgi:hypothetical protein
MRVEAEVRRSLLRRSRDVDEATGALSAAISTASSGVNHLRRRDTRALKGIGVLMMALPDPFTDVAGAGLLLAAKMLSKDGIEDLIDESSKILRDLRNL